MTEPALPDVPWRRSLSIAARDIKLAHSVFALPFALLAAGMALEPGADAPSITARFALIIWCMVSARTWAMLVNRILDRSFDSRNPRTARRALPSGALDLRRARTLAAFAAAALLLGAAGFWTFFRNPWPLALALPVLAWIALYSLTKRFTALCHLVLGSALAASPLAAALAIRPHALIDHAALWFLAAMVLLWVAGFDIIYALADADFDRAHRLHSIPAALGPRASAWVSRLLHAACWVCLLLAWRAEPRFNLAFLVASLGAGLLLILEHLILTRRGLAGIPLAFFTINGIVSCILGAAGLLDLTLSP
ncbi:MAG: 4-hydroxybenzoate octaprenyltransferase [Phycisphaerales bacterium]|nr:4-hydroxybenzoate octaprenyltransferase [Phycisphaerales bacterium]